METTTICGRCGLERTATHNTLVCSEREACARIADKIAEIYALEAARSHAPQQTLARAAVAHEIAFRIRNRVNQEEEILDKLREYYREAFYDSATVIVDAYLDSLERETQ